MKDESECNRVGKVEKSEERKMNRIGKVCLSGK